MPGKKTPTALVAARGGLSKPSRARNSEPKVKGPLGSPPEGLAPDEVAAWQEIAKCAPIGVLTAADGMAVVMAARLYAEAQRDFEGMNAARLARLHSLLGDFGMTPSARASLSVPQPKEVNPFSLLGQHTR